ncbi:aminotransferase class I/II-fold pyridoxal phosphate-dependent enzyme [Roseibacterium beibuensis]|uniref:Perosamine synthetase n=1 Tax=[Roseibacterium] beibuensis TaxID=1193142 RepID=A0ABP9LRW1_9RHOB|nr:aminotransferase class I/II-fold pyridoxal phosphate-dependent enzyme [Roseibacterium beibuensis]MCS6627801.1 aminotransferase class I/II-fold pyridoxal phosphate-dependent enzyme [Roseibacterium beibuensis]
MGVSNIDERNWPKSHPWGPRELELLEEALGGNDWSHTSMCREFEAKFARFVGTAYALMVPSGTSAIYLSLLAGGIKPGQEVIIPGITWPSVVYAILKSGGVPRTVDIDPDSFCMSAKTIKRSLNEKTFAILATHLFGSQCEMNDICNLASKNGILVIEDAAQSIGSIQDSRHCGTWGSFGSFSWNDKKVLACGEGGVIVTNDGAAYEELLRLQLILPERDRIPRHVPGTYKVSEFQGAVAIAQLERLERRLAKMAKGAKLLEKIILDQGSQKIAIQKKPDKSDLQSYYNFCLKIDGVEDSSRIIKELSARLGCRVTKPYKPISKISDFKPTREYYDKRIWRNLNETHEICDLAYRSLCLRLPFFVLEAEDTLLVEAARIIVELVEEHTG